MIKNVIGTVKGALMFYEGNGVEVINENTDGRYLKDRKGRMTLNGDLLDASEEWVLGLPVVGLRARDNTIIIYVDGWKQKKLPKLWVVFLYILPIDNPKTLWYNWAARDRTWRAVFLSIGGSHKFLGRIFV